MNREIELANGVNGSTGDYLSFATPAEVSHSPEESRLSPMALREREWWVERYGIDDPQRVAVRDVDECNLASAGWGVLFAPGVGAGVKEALRPLLDHRREQASRLHDRYYGEYTWVQGQSKEDFLAEHGAGFGPANPEKLPYFLLIVGDPRAIPFRFQYELDVQYAVGRIDFDRDEDYASYADSVLAVERGGRSRPRDLTFFGVGNDSTTQRTVEELIRPLADSVLSGRPHWDKNLVIGRAATKVELSRLLNGRDTPAILFTSCHGLRYELGDARLRSNQGALLCQDWPGPSKEKKAIDPDHYFSAGDLSPDTDLTGLLAIQFACYSAGTPEFDNFSVKSLGKPERVAPYPFVSALGRRLLSCGAMAVLGHIDRAWTYSFSDSSGRGHCTEVFESLLKSLVDGMPLGFAMEYVNQRYAELSVRLSNLLMDREELRGPHASTLARVKRANNDARNYVVLGDPAVSLKPTM